MQERVALCAESNPQGGRIALRCFTLRALLDAVTVVVSKRGSGLEAIARPAHQMNDGPWQVDGLLIPLAGEWSARVEILVGDFELIRLEGPVEIAP